MGEVLFDWLFLFVGVVFEVIGFPLWMKWIPRNQCYGVRTEQTLSDDLTWYKVNQLGGKILFFQGFGAVLIAVLLFGLPFSLPLALVIVCFFGYVLGGIGVLLYLIREQLKTIEDFGTVSATTNDAFSDL
mmetsp:Transcript_99/g.209  ORF Transcript_99/g.209 Transcript_99/m.209 type:complete len:130 (-) Transcript_99:13-402(-)